MSIEAETKARKEALDAVLDELPPESLEMVRQFAEFLRRQAQQRQPVVTVAEPGAPYLYPSVATPVAVMQALSGVLVEGYDGDAVADTEALYDGN
jgi:hypothetical protein